MADSYVNVNFDVLMPGDFRPGWRREPNVRVTHVPGSAEDDVQFGGLGNWRIRVEALLDSDTADADIATLQAALSNTARTLVLFGTSYASTYLIDVGDPQRAEGYERWRVQLEFMRQGT